MATETFRTSLNGFNRTDVVQFIQKMTTNHEKELKSLREENEKNSEALELLRSDSARLEAQNAELTEKLAALEAQNAELTAQLEAAKNAVPSPAPAEAPAAPVAAQIAERELAAYRRAEGMERKARERAEATTKLLKGVFSKATDRLNAGTARETGRSCLWTLLFVFFVFFTAPEMAGQRQHQIARRGFFLRGISQRPRQRLPISALPDVVQRSGKRLPNGGRALAAEPSGLRADHFHLRLGGHTEYRHRDRLRQNIIAAFSPVPADALNHHARILSHTPTLLLM